MRFFKKAFTLAEIIMVMGIIGIVATLTVTSAKKDTDVAEKVMQLKKTEQILSTAFAQAVAENGPLRNWGTNGANPTNAEVWTILTQYLKLQKNCGTSSGCWTSGDIGFVFEETNSGSMYHKNIDNSTNYQKGILSNGASIAYGENIGTCFHVDVNGKDKGTYRIADDVFGFMVSNDGVEITQKITSVGISDTLSQCINSQSIYCTTWVLQFGNQDYLKDCADELSWEGPHTCK